ncbi:putative lysophospholipase protein [Plesiocystis pacifica SIR-1]|uniref:Putative lysophospholipase protein n=1 Tax=Plesiocystis pacifica SIR-1 TaxID=391625 RepID=A6G7J8_9BACT|nr:alpha/beta fold hydrolase [Plesiocystis pacifica]EDM78207.1 putative lysophospholipase protein [Plesiocystis pacifica SIR-1]
MAVALVNGRARVGLVAVFAAGVGLGSGLSAGGCQDACEPPPEFGLGEPTAWEQAFLDGGGLPPSPPPSQTLAEDGLALVHYEWIPAGWTGEGPAVVFVHGSSAHAALYSLIGQTLADEGVYARLIDLRGHGRSVCLAEDACGDPSGPRSFVDDGRYWAGRPGDSADPDQIVRDLRQHLDEVRAAWPEAPLFVAGHSSGGGVVSRMVATGGMAGLSGAMLLAPFNHPEQPQNELGSWDCGRVVGTDYAHVHLPVLGAARRGEVHRYTLSFHKPPEYADPLDTLWNSYTTAQGMAAPDPESFHAAFTQPTLWVVGEQDALFDLDASRAEHARMPGAAAFVVVEDTSHVGISWSAGTARLLADFAKDPASVAAGTISPG